MNTINVFGSTGFVGGAFCNLYPDLVIPQQRADYCPKTSNILYFISTVDNYNIHTDVHVDINTNLNTLMSVLDNLDKSDKSVVFNFVSSWFVYGKNEVMPFHEEKSICNPTGFYSITKRAAEQMLISYCETFGIKYRIFRLSNILGEGDMKISRKKNALQYMIKCLCEDADVELYDGGTTVRDYMYVDDACSAILHCMEKAPTNQIINIANGKPYVVGEVLDLAYRKAQSRSKIINIAPPHFHSIVQVKNSYLNVTKLQSYGFTNKFNIEDIVDRLVSFYKSSAKNKI